MPVKGIDHLYLETRSFDEAVAFWERLGFTLTQCWGQDGHTAGRLEAGNTYIVLAESQTPVLNLHFGASDIEKLGTPETTHWGARLLRVQDPDGRTFVLEETK
jgi:catechol 2,3-dioxygenase-like lactoylglutathione lyase family enzyme